MTGRGREQSNAATPTMVGAITTLIIIVAVFLAYNANNGLPFVPVYRVSAIIPNAARLGRNNEVRIGGHRVGVVESIDTVRDPQTGQAAARLNLKLNKSVQPLPADTKVRVRYRSSFGLKYLELTRGSGKALPEGATIPIRNAIPQTEFDDIANTFDTRTRENVRINLEGFGNAFAARGSSLNEAIAALNPLFLHLEPVARILIQPGTKLENFFKNLGRTSEIVAPVADANSELFTNMAITFAAISQDPEALKAGISEGVPTQETAIRVLPFQTVFLEHFAHLSRILRPGIRELRIALPSLNSAISVGTPVLRRTPAMNAELKRVFSELEQLVEQPETKITLTRLTDTFNTARSAGATIVPFETACNYWNYWFTFLPEHLSEPDIVGTTQRVTLVAPPGNNPLVPQAEPDVQGPLAGYSGIQANGKEAFTQAYSGAPSGGTSPATANPPAGSQGPPIPPIAIPGFTANAGVPNPGRFEPHNLPILHGNPYAPSGTNSQPNCQGGQTGYALGQALAPGQSPSNPTFGIPNIAAAAHVAPLGKTNLKYDQSGKRYFQNFLPGTTP
jgi:ABC-type transporter Mla subunit MlaD